jgi:hypothetical protein
VADIERLIELLVRESATQVQERCCRPLVVVEQSIEQIHPMTSRLFA